MDIMKIVFPAFFNLSLKSPCVLSSQTRMPSSSLAGLFERIEHHHHPSHFFLMGDMVYPDVDRIETGIDDLEELSDGDRRRLLGKRYEELFRDPGVANMRSKMSFMLDDHEVDFHRVMLDHFKNDSSPVL